MYQCIILAFLAQKFIFSSKEILKIVCAFRWVSSKFEINPVNIFSDKNRKINHSCPFRYLTRTVNILKGIPNAIITVFFTIFSKK